MDFCNRSVSTTVKKKSEKVGAVNFKIQSALAQFELSVKGSHRGMLPAIYHCTQHDWVPVAQW